MMPSAMDRARMALAESPYAKDVILYGSEDAPDFEAQGWVPMEFIYRLAKTVYPDRDLGCFTCWATGRGLDSAPGPCTHG